MEAPEPGTETDVEDAPEPVQADVEDAEQDVEAVDEAPGADRSNRTNRSRI